MEPRAITTDGQFAGAVFAQITHELRNPMAPLCHAIELLGQQLDRNPELRSLHGLMHRQAGQLRRLIDDLVALQHAERDAFELRMQPLRLDLLLSEVITHLGDTLAYRELRLEPPAPCGPLWVDGDRDRLTQVFTNLLQNAAKFTPAGGHVRVTLSPRGREVRVGIADSGIGLRSDELGHIFELYRRGGDRSCHPPGLGIGLYLVRLLVTRHGGHVEAHSAGPGCGSEFVVRLPLARDRTQAAGHRASPRPVRRRLLIVDDEPDTADLLGTLLRRQGHEVAVAYDGAGALALGADVGPELILLDLGMPMMDGFACCAAMRRLPWGKAASILAVSGWPAGDTAERCRRKGFDGGLTKPVTLATLEPWLSAAPSQPGAPGQARGARQ